MNGDRLTSLLQLLRNSCRCLGPQLNYTAIQTDADETNITSSKQQLLLLTKFYNNESSTTPFIEVLIEELHTLNSTFHTGTSSTLALIYFILSSFKNKSIERKDLCDGLDVFLSCYQHICESVEIKPFHQYASNISVKDSFINKDINDVLLKDDSEIDWFFADDDEGNNKDPHGEEDNNRSNSNVEEIWTLEELCLALDHDLVDNYYNNQKISNICVKLSSSMSIAKEIAQYLWAAHLVGNNNLNKQVKNKNISSSWIHKLVFLYIPGLYSDNEVIFTSCVIPTSREKIRSLYNSCSNHGVYNSCSGVFFHRTVIINQAILINKKNDNFLSEEASKTKINYTISGDNIVDQLYNYYNHYDQSISLIIAKLLQWKVDLFICLAGNMHEEELLIDQLAQHGITVVFVLPNMISSLSKLSGAKIGYSIDTINDTFIGTELLFCRHCVSTMSMTAYSSELPATSDTTLLPHLILQNISKTVHATSLSSPSSTSYFKHLTIVLSAPIFSIADALRDRIIRQLARVHAVLVRRNYGIVPGNGLVELRCMNELDVLIQKAENSDIILVLECIQQALFGYVLQLRTNMGSDYLTSMDQLRIEKQLIKGLVSRHDIEKLYADATLSSGLELMTRSSVFDAMEVKLCSIETAINFIKFIYV